MRQKSVPEKAPAEQVVKDIRRATRRQFSIEEKIWTVRRTVQLGHSYALTSVFILNHEQAKTIAAVIAPDGHSDIHYLIDLLEQFRL